jgi:uncharacterized protein
MAEYLSPGVYVEEIDAGPKPIEGVSTSTAGAVGVTALGPTDGKPQLVTSFTEFVRTFGGFLPTPAADIVNKWSDQTEGGYWWQFPLCVKGFFDNGGQRLWVKRVFSSKAAASMGTLGKGLVSQLKRDAEVGAQQIQLLHLFNVFNGVKIKIFTGDSNTQIGGDFTVQSYDAATGMVTLDTPLAAALRVKRGDFAEIHTLSASDVPAGEQTLTFLAKAKGGWSDKGLSVRVRPVSGTAMTILPSSTKGGATLTTTVAALAVSGAANLEVKSVKGLQDGDIVLINDHKYTVSNVSTPDPTTVLKNPANVGSTTVDVVAVGPIQNGKTVDIGGERYKVTAVNGNALDLDHAVVTGVAAGGEVYLLPRGFDIKPAVPEGEVWKPGTMVQRLRPANDSSTPANSIAVWGASSLYTGAIVELDNGTQKESFTVVKVEGDVVTLSGNLKQQYEAGDLLRVIEAEVTARYAPDGQTPVEETYSPLRLKDDGSINFLVNYINTKSSLVQVLTAPGFSDSDLPAFPASPNGNWLALTGGDDKLDELSVDDFVGVDGGSGKRTGIQALEDITDISICMVPGMWSTTIQSSLIQHCEALRYRFAILDPQDGLDIEHILAFRESLVDTKYAALYYPWVKVRDPSVKQEVAVAPAGHMAGIYARVDVDRGVHKAPANEVILGINAADGFSQDVTKREQDVLNPKGINALRFFPGRGNRVWGARTISSDSSWKYVNVRRLFIFVERSIDEGTQWVVFEPNYEPLWARVRQTITNFLTTVWRSGALEGSKPDQAFFVKCDHTTMTQDDIDNGRLICLVGIAPVKPAEFVIFRIQQFTVESQTT